MRAARTVFLDISEALPDTQLGVRRRYFAVARNNLCEVAAAVDLAVAIGALPGPVAAELAARMQRVGALVAGLLRQPGPARGPSRCRMRVRTGIVMAQQGAACGGVLRRRVGAGNGGSGRDSPGGHRSIAVAISYRAAPDAIARPRSHVRARTDTLWQMSWSTATTLFSALVSAAVVLASRVWLDKRLERYRGELATQIEKERQAFADAQRKLQKSAQRQLAQENLAFLDHQRMLQAALHREIAELSSRFSRELEHLRASLSRDVEIRKLAAARTVAALEDIAEQGEPLLRTALDTSNSEQRLAACNAFFELIRSKQHLVDEATYQQFHRYHAGLRAEADKSANDPSAFMRAAALQAEFMAVIRDGLRIPTLAVASEAVRVAQAMGED